MTLLVHTTIYICTCLQLYSGEGNTKLLSLHPLPFTKDTLLAKALTLSMANMDYIHAHDTISVMALSGTSFGMIFPDLVLTAAWFLLRMLAVHGLSTVCWAWFFLPVSPLSTTSWPAWFCSTFPSPLGKGELWLTNVSLVISENTICRGQVFLWIWPVKNALQSPWQLFYHFVLYSPDIMLVLHVCLEFHVMSLHVLIT